jgi:hypothetical protein
LSKFALVQGILLTPNWTGIKVRLYQVITMKALKSKNAALFIFVLIIISNNLKSQSDFIWGKQFGSEKNEYALNHLIDENGNIYIAGKTDGVVEGKNFGKNDGFILKIDSSANTIWSRQFGTDGEEDIQWSAIDNRGCVYITGSTTGVFNGKKSGKEDIFIIKYDPQGEEEWKKQFGTDSTDIAKGIHADNKGFIYLTGMTGGKLGQSSYGKTDAFIMKLDINGNHIFTTQFGTAADDFSYAITGGNESDIFVCGTTFGDIAGKNKGFMDGFTGHFTDRGDLIRYDQFGSEGFDLAMILSVDEEKNIYVGGSTSGNFACQQLGEGDCYLLKINEKGEILWNRQFGTAKHDGVRSIDLDSKISDNILISGILNLPPSQGFMRMFNKNGDQLWERKFIAVGSYLATSGKDVNFDNKGNIYHMGLTGANMFGISRGEADIYLVKLALDRCYFKIK